MVKLFTLTPKMSICFGSCAVCNASFHSLAPWRPTPHRGSSLPTSFVQNRSTRLSGLCMQACCADIMFCSSLAMGLRYYMLNCAPPLFLHLTHLKASSVYNDNGCKLLQLQDCMYHEACTPASQKCFLQNDMSARLKLSENTRQCIDVLHRMRPMHCMCPRQGCSSNIEHACLQRLIHLYAERLLMNRNTSGREAN